MQDGRSTAKGVVTHMLRTAGLGVFNPRGEGVERPILSQAQSGSSTNFSCTSGLLTAIL